MSWIENTAPYTQGLLSLSLNIIEYLYASEDLFYDVSVINPNALIIDRYNFLC